MVYDPPFFRPWDKSTLFEAERALDQLIVEGEPASAILTLLAHLRDTPAQEHSAWRPLVAAATIYRLADLVERHIRDYGSDLLVVPVLVAVLQEACAPEDRPKILGYVSTGDVLADKAHPALAPAVSKYHEQIVELITRAGELPSASETHATEGNLTAASSAPNEPVAPLLTSPDLRPPANQAPRDYWRPVAIAAIILLAVSVVIALSREEQPSDPEDLIDLQNPTTRMRGDGDFKPKPTFVLLRDAREGEPGEGSKEVRSGDHVLPGETVELLAQCTLDADLFAWLVPTGRGSAIPLAGSVIEEGGSGCDRAAQAARVRCRAPMERTCIEVGPDASARHDLPPGAYELVVVLVPAGTPEDQARVNIAWVPSLLEWQAVWGSSAAVGVVQSHVEALLFEVENDAIQPTP